MLALLARSSWGLVEALSFSTVCFFVLVALIVFAVLVALVRDPDPVEPASLESGQPRDAVRSAMERER